MRIIIIGPPGSGKTTQGLLISKKYNVNFIGTGDLVRKGLKSNYKSYKEVVDKGNLLPDEVVFALVKEHLIQLGIHKGFILEGYPRTLVQSKLLDKLLAEENVKVNYVFYFNINNNMLKERIIKRLKEDDIDRVDDDPEIINNRMGIYLKESLPIREYYKEKNILFDINAEKSIEEIFKNITEKIDTLEKVNLKWLLLRMMKNIK